MYLDMGMRVTAFQNDVTMVTFLDAKILDDEQIQLIGDELLQLHADGMRKCILNLQNVIYVSSNFLQRIIVLQKTMKGNGKLVLCSISAAIQEVLAMTTIDRMLLIAQDEADAFLAVL